VLLQVNEANPVRR